MFATKRRRGSYIFNAALELAKSRSSKGSLLRFVRKEFFYENQKATFRELTGIDLDTDPNEQEILEAIKSYAASPYYGMQFADSSAGETAWTKDIRGARLPSDRGLMVRVIINDYNLLLAGQWEVYSGGQRPSRIELETQEVGFIRPTTILPT